MPGPVSITGPGASGEVGGMLDPTLPMSMVYPIAAPALNVRRNTLVISAGPIGGGGLNVYGALNCGKIYSIFLPMPGRNWSMQYCDKSANAGKSAPAARSGMVYLEKPLVPPDVDLAHRFDFKRIPIPPEKSHRSIILKGVIAIDGTVQEVTVYQGVAPEMDEAARIAFSRWKFKPAMQDGKAVAVEILVGIPPLTGEDRVNR
jgi:Gram-negative bacterial TonB protein C-terminal